MDDINFKKDVVFFLIEEVREVSRSLDVGGIKYNIACGDSDVKKRKI